MNKEIKKRRIKLYIKITVLIVITLIGCYGIIKAPKSDKDILERELAENERALQQTNRPHEYTNAPTETVSPGSNSSETARPQTSADDDTDNNAPYNTSTPEAGASKTDAPQGGSSLTPYPDRPADNKTEKDNNKKDKDKTDAPDKSGKDISVIGDSVFLGASPSFKELYQDAVIDAKVSRQVSQGLGIAKELDKNGSLGSTVIISLGTNGNFNESTGQELIDYLGPDRTIYWINAYGKKLAIQDDVNKTINKLANENDNVHVISWAKKAKKHSDWFYQDGIHLNKEGQKGFAKFVSGAINGEE